MTNQEFKDTLWDAANVLRGGGIGRRIQVPGAGADFPQVCERSVRSPGGCDSPTPGGPEIGPLYRKRGNPWFPGDRPNARSCSVVV